MITLDLSPEVEQALLSQAQARGVPVEKLIQELVLTQPPLAFTEIPAEQWVREFREWVHSHSHTTPLHSDEAISREEIYRERGL